ncbi:MAG: ROK family protein [Christensenellales bacterium]
MSLRLGIDLGGTSIKLGLVDQDRNILRRAAIPTQDDFHAATRDIASAARHLAEEEGLSLQQLPFLGIGVPSTVHPLSGRLMLANNTGWQNAPLREALEEQAGIPVLVANDADCALAGEAAAGGARGLDNVLMLTLGTGVGGALLMGGLLYSGGDGMGMELGHQPLIAGGWPCTCGADGCLEAYVSATGLIALTRQAMGQAPDSLMHAQAPGGDVTGETAFQCALQGDKAALAVIDCYAAWLAQGIGGLVNVFRPGLVLVGGGVSHAGAPLFERVNRALPRFILAYSVIGGPPVRAATLGNDAGIIGAAFLDQVQRGRTEHV